jgi:alanine racemase
MSTHFANLEDRLNQQYARHQLREFQKAEAILNQLGIKPHYRHCAATAGIIALPEAHFNFVRLGIGAYGLWPSPKTKIAAERLDVKMELKPVLTWKTIVAQVKPVKKGDLVGYGCSHEMKQNGKIAVLPIGYYDGFVRTLGNKGAVLIRGHRAPVIGRVCMNMIMVDVTDIPNVRLEDEVVLIGEQGSERITAEDMAELSGTINYEVTTRIGERIPRNLTP